MSVIVIDDYENVDLIKNFRVFIIDDNESSNLQNSINSIEKISKYISITIFTNHNLSIDKGNIEIVKYDQNFLGDFNKCLLDSSQEFFCILNSGDTIIEEPIKDAIINNFSNIGAIVFDDNIDFKPGFSLDLYLEKDYIFNSVLFNRNAVNAIGGFDAEFKNNFIRDVIFRLYYSEFNIIKEDRVAFNINNEIDNNSDEDLKFIKKQLDSRNVKFSISKKNNIIVPEYDALNKKASIIIPFKDQASVTKVCVDSILKKTTYENYEIILINNNSVDEETFKYLSEAEKNPKVKVFNYFQPFNWSKINNFGFTKASGDVLIFLNNDTEVINEDWLKLLVGDAIQDNVGTVGAMLYFPDDSIQHAGVVIGLNSLASHIFSGVDEKDIPDLYKNYRRNVSSVTGACLAIERDLFNEVKGFNEHFEVSFSDVEISLKLLKKGYRNIFNSHAKLYHHEMKTRSKKEFREIDRILGYNTFEFYFDNGDPFFNKNISLNYQDKLVLRGKTETPGFKKYWTRWSGSRNRRVNNVHEAINKTGILSDEHSFQHDFSNDELIRNLVQMDNYFDNPHLELNNLLWFIPSLDSITEDKLFNLLYLPNHLSINEKSNNIFVLPTKGYAAQLTKYIKANFPSLKFELSNYEDINKLPKIDAAFCLDWKTSFDLLKYDGCDAKFYLINNYGYSYNNSLKQSYNFDFVGISDSSNMISNHYSQNTSSIYFNPIVNKDVYYFDDSVKKINKSIIFYVEDVDSDEFKLGIEVLKVLRAYFRKGIKIFVVGVDFDSSEYGLSDVVTNLGIINSSEKLAGYYRKCLSALILSPTHNIQNHILNFMACGCVTFTNYNRDLSDIFVGNENVVFVEDCFTSISEDIIRVLHDTNFRNKIVKIGQSTINRLDVDGEMDNVVGYIKNSNLTLQDTFNSPLELHRPENSSKLSNKELLIQNNIPKNRERDYKIINQNYINLIQSLTDEVEKLRDENKALSNNSSRFNKFFK